MPQEVHPAPETHPASGPPDRHCDVLEKDAAASTVSRVAARVFPSFGKLPNLPPKSIFNCVGAVSGALAVISFLALPIVKVSFLGKDFTRTGTDLIQSNFESNEVQGIAVSVALIVALIAAGLGALFFLWDRYKHGPKLGGLSLSILVALWIYLVIWKESTEIVAVGLWLSLLFLLIMSTSTLLSYSYSRVAAVKPDRDDEVSQ